MQSSKLLLLGVIGQGPHQYADDVIPPTMGLSTFADCNVTVAAFNASTGDPITSLEADQTLTLRLTFTNAGTFPFTCVMPQAVMGLELDYGWTDSYPIVPAGGTASTEADVFVIAGGGEIIEFAFVECPEPLTIPVAEVIPANLLWHMSVNPGVPADDFSPEAIAYYAGLGVVVDSMSYTLAGGGRNPAWVGNPNGQGFPGVDEEFLSGSTSLLYAKPGLTPTGSPTGNYLSLIADGASVGGHVEQFMWSANPADDIATNQIITIEHAEVLDANGNILRTLPNDGVDSTLSLTGITIPTATTQTGWWPFVSGLKTTPYRVKLFGTMVPPPDPTTIEFQRPVIHINPLGVNAELYGSAVYTLPSFFALSYPRLVVEEFGAGWPVPASMRLQYSGDLIAKTADMEASGLANQYFYLNTLTEGAINMTTNTADISVVEPVGGVSISTTETNSPTTPAFCAYPGVTLTSLSSSYNSNGVDYTVNNATATYSFTHAVGPVSVTPAAIYYYVNIRAELPVQTPTEIMFPEATRKLIYYEVVASGAMDYAGASTFGGTNFNPVNGGTLLNGGIFNIATKSDGTHWIRATVGGTSKELMFTYNPAGTVFGVLVDGYNKRTKISVDGQYYDFTTNTLVSDPANALGYAAFSPAAGSSIWTPYAFISLQLTKTFQVQFRYRNTDTYTHMPAGAVVWHDATRVRNLSLNIAITDTLGSDLAIGTPSSMTYEMILANPTYFSFTSPVFSVGATATSVPVSIERKGSLLGPVSVRLGLLLRTPNANTAPEIANLRNNGFGVKNADAVESSQVFTWQAGEGGIKTQNFALTGTAGPATKTRKIYLNPLSSASYMSNPPFEALSWIEIHD
jgi:hypothetical protein